MQIKGIQKADQNEYKQIQFLLIGLTPASFSLSGILAVIILNILFLPPKFSQEMSYPGAQWSSFSCAHKKDPVHIHKM